MPVTTAVAVGLRNQLAFGGVDLNAKAFITNAGITDSIQKSAINKYVKELKAINSIQANFVDFDSLPTSLIKALYIYVGGGVSSHKFNLLSPIDADASFRLTQTGNVTHNSLGVKSDGTSGYFNSYLVASANLSLNNSFVATYFGSWPTATNRYSIATVDAAGGRILQTGRNAANKGAGFMYNSNTGQGFIESTESFEFKGKLQCINRFDGKYNIWINGVKSTENTNLTSGALPTRALKLLALDNNGTISAWEPRQIMLQVIGKGLSDAAIIAFTTACNNLQKNLNRYPVESRILFDGDSRTFGIRAGVTSPYPDQLMAMYSVPKLNQWTNYGVSGQTLTQMNSDAASQIDSQLDNSKDKNIVLIWGGVNDFGTELGTTKEVIYQRLKTYCQGRKAAGLNVLVFTELPQSNVAYATRTDYENERQWFNNQIRTDLLASGFIDGVVDVGADTTIGLAGSQNNSTYYLSDLIHLTNAGYGIVAGLAKVELDKLLIV